MSACTTQCRVNVVKRPAEFQRGIRCRYRGANIQAVCKTAKRVGCVHAANSERGTFERTETVRSGHGDCAHDGWMMQRTMSAGHTINDCSVKTTSIRIISNTRLDADIIIYFV